MRNRLNNILRQKNFIFIFQILLILVTAIYFQSCSSSDKNGLITDDPEEAFRAAKKSYDKKDYLQAIEDFSYIKVKFSGTKIIDQSQYYLAMSYFNRKEYILSAYEFDYLVKNYPTSEFISKARYQLALCYYNLSPNYDLDQTYTYYAISGFLDFLELYPKDQNAPEAEKKIYELRNKLALKDYKSGVLYFRMENYKSAIVYFNNVLEGYFDSEYADDALYMKIQALIKRSKYDEAIKEIDRFEKKFATSEYLKQVIEIKNSLYRGL